MLPPPPPPPVPPQVPWTARDVWWGIILLAFVFAAFVLALVAFVPEPDLGLLVTVGELLMLAPVVVFALWKRRAGWRALGFRAFSAWTLALAAALLALAFFVSALYAAFLARFDLQVQADLAPLLAELETPWWFVLGAAVVAPLVEEVFFRGFMFAGFRERYGWGRAALLSSALFAIVHGEWTAFPPIFLLGLILAYLYQRSGSLWPGILFHVANNAAAVAAVYWFLGSGAGGGL